LKEIKSCLTAAPLPAVTGGHLMDLRVATSLIKDLTSLRRLVIPTSRVGALLVARAGSVLLVSPVIIEGLLLQTQGGGFGQVILELLVVVDLRLI